MKNHLTAIINTFNEEGHIEDCIKSLSGLTQSIVVVDSGSTDRTVEIAKRCGAVIQAVHRFQYVEQIRNISIAFVPDGWIIILDADERVTPELTTEIKKIIEDPHTSDHTHFKIPRKNIFNGKRWMKHGGWWPDYQIRLFEKNAFVQWPEHIHSTPEFKGSLGYLTNPIKHLVVSSLSDMVQKTLLFEDIESDLLFKANKKANAFTFFRKFLGELYRRLIKHRGFMDGSVGIIESIYQAYSKTITYLFLYEKQHANDTKKSRTL